MGKAGQSDTVANLKDPNGAKSRRGSHWQGSYYHSCGEYMAGMGHIL